jgi:micrococcal nuclease
MKRARHRRALFALDVPIRHLLALALLLVASPAPALPPAAAVPLPESCQAPVEDHGHATVDHIYDGDTVRLNDGTRVRLIGLDTPEFHHRDPDREPEAFAARALEALTAVLAANGHRVRLVHDRERHDRYQRTLAHLFTPDGQSISALMLAQGLGTRLTVPPNDWNLDCYRDAERGADAGGKGIWSRPENRVFEAADLPRNAEGFRRVTGRVVRLGESSRAHWVNLEGDVALRIDRKDLQYFDGFDVESLQDRRVRARGHVYNYRGQPRIRIRHPADLEIIDPRTETSRGTP